MEQNKVRTYLIYAIGEIALVMIGILLALQVNNWNEKRNNVALGNQYLASLRADLEEDLDMLDEGYERAYSDSLQLDFLINRIKESQLHADTIKSIVLLEYDELVMAPRAHNIKTYTTLISTGDISLINKEITQKMVQLVKEQDIRIRLINTPIEQYISLFKSFGKDYPIKNDPFSSVLLPKVYDQINAIKLLNDFNSLASLKNTNTSRLMTRRRILKPITEDLIKLINKNLAL